MLTEWDKFNTDSQICRKVGCRQWNIDVCCPELMCTLCNPKSNLLKKIGISEDDLNDNKVTIKEIKEKIELEGDEE